MSTMPSIPKSINDAVEINESEANLDRKHHIVQTLGFLHPKSVTFELTCIGTITPKSDLWEGFAGASGGKKPIITGFFIDHQKAAEAALALDLDRKVQPIGIYVTLNPCDPALIARASERLKAGINRTATDNIISLNNFLVDIDPVRPTGISSSDQEHQWAIEKAHEIKEYLTGLGWPEPLVGDSGNGAHLVYKTDSENTQENIEIRQCCLKTLNEKFSTSGVQVDEQVFDPPRITKLYGTTVRKGDHIPDRPHRLAKIISIPAEPKVVPVELLKALADMAPEASRKSTAQKFDQVAAYEGMFDLSKYLEQYKVAVKKSKPHGSSTLHVLEECLFDSGHAGGEAAIGQAENGTLFYQCFHDSCKDRTWKDARKVISGDEKLDSFMLHTVRVQQESKYQNAMAINEATGAGKIILPAPPRFPIEVFPPSTRSLIEKVAAAHAVPVEIPASVFLVVAGACIGRTRGIEIKKGWVEHPNLYVGLVGRSGVGKSPATKTVLRPVFELEKQWYQEYSEQVRAFEEGDDKSSEPRPQWRQLIVEDTSPEALSDALSGNPRGILWYRDELSGLLLEMDKYSNRAGGTKTRLMSAYDSGAWKVTRISARRNCFIPNATLSIYGTVQPMALPNIFSNLDAVTGFLPRFIFLRVDRETPPFWTDEGISADVPIALAGIIQALLGYDFVDEDKPLIVPVSPAARMRFIEWFNQQVSEPWRNLDGILYEALLAKLRGQCLRLCLILHCMGAYEKRQSELLLVSEATMANAIRLADCFKEHQKQVWQFLVNPAKIHEISPLQKQVIRAILNLQDEIRGGMLPTALVTEKINEGMNDKFHVSSMTVGRAAVSLGFSTKHIPGETTRGICITDDDLARLKPLVEISGLNGTSGSDPLPTEVDSQSVTGNEVVQTVLDEPANHLDHIQAAIEKPVNEHGTKDETTSTTCTTCIQQKVEEKGRDALGWELRNAINQLTSCCSMRYLKHIWESSVDGWMKRFTQFQFAELIAAKDRRKKQLECPELLDEDDRFGRGMEEFLMDMKESDEKRMSGISRA